MDLYLPVTTHSYRPPMGVCPLRCWESRERLFPVISYVMWRPCPCIGNRRLVGFCSFFFLPSRDARGPKYSHRGQCASRMRHANSNSSSRQNYDPLVVPDLSSWCHSSTRLRNVEECNGCHALSSSFSVHICRRSYLTAASGISLPNTGVSRFKAEPSYLCLSSQRRRIHGGSAE